MSEKLKAKYLSKKTTKEYMDEAFYARETRKLVLYASAQSPIEIFVTHDIIPVQPENRAVACLTSRLGTDTGVHSKAHREGFISYKCGTARIVVDIYRRNYGWTALGCGKAK